MRPRNQPGNYSIIGDHPEFYTAERIYPTGRFDDYQQHQVRGCTRPTTWSSARPARSRSALIYRYDSALTYSLLTNNVADHAAAAGP